MLDALALARSKMEETAVMKVFGEGVSVQPQFHKKPQFKL